MEPDMTVIGYARVSTDGQSLEAQHAALTQAGAERVFAEKISGAVTDRKQLAKAIADALVHQIFARGDSGPAGWNLP
jgi:DNA invertase Pin-like site-specific DNA recombinase